MKQQKPIPILSPQDIVRFWDNVSVKSDNDCWEWLGCKKSHHINRNYGQIGIQGGIYLSHRVGWELVYGPIPENFKICHTCDNPPCCNPEHWFLGTQADNVLDREYKGRGNQAKGEKHGVTHLTTQDVITIRQRVHNGEFQYIVGQSFNLSNQQVSNIIRRVSWPHI